MTTVRFTVSPSTSPAPSPTPGGQDPRHRPWTHRQLPTPFQEEAGSGDSRQATQPHVPPRGPQQATLVSLVPSHLTAPGLPARLPGPSLSGGPAVAPRDGPFAESLGQWLCQGLSKLGGQRPGKMKQTPPTALSGGIFRPPEMGAAGRVQAVSAPQELESGGSRWLTRKHGHL